MFCKTMNLLKRLNIVGNNILLRFFSSLWRSNIVLGKRVILFVPIRCDGEGTVKVGDGTTLGAPLAPRAGNGEVLLQAREPGSILNIGKNVAFSNNVSIVATEEIIIGDNSLIGDFCLIMDSDFHEIDPILRRSGTGIRKPVVIGRNVWLGSRVVVQKGVTIGENCVIAAQSVVARDIPPNSIAGGNPAKVLRSI